MEATMQWLVLLAAGAIAIGDHLLARWQVPGNPSWELAKRWAHYPPTPALNKRKLNEGYRLSRLFEGDPSRDSLFIVLAFSGGGTRAAAFSYGVVSELKAWKSIDERSTLLDHVALVSSISGGSTTAAYWAAHGTDRLPELEQKYLYSDWNLQAEVSLPSSKQISRMHSPYFGPSDYAAELWARQLFSDTRGNPITYAQLDPLARPFFLLNATDIATGVQFSFSQEQFDPICADLSGFPLARAMAASGAFPVVMNPITLESHRFPAVGKPISECRWDYPPAGWAEMLMKDTLHSASSLWARSLIESGANPTIHFIHLIDGGVADNVGLRPILLALQQDTVPWSLSRQIESERIKRFAVIVVNSAVHDPGQLYSRDTGPGFVESVLQISGTPLERLTAETIGSLWSSITQLQKTKQSARLYALEVSADRHPDSRETAFFNTMPTSYHLESSDAKRIVRMAGTILRCSRIFQRLAQGTQADHPQFHREPEAGGSCDLSRQP
jgi:NTE family protein